MKMKTQTSVTLRGGDKKYAKPRIDYIDLIKGITIIGVVWVHTNCPEWLTAILVNSIFFFLSGIFFKRTPFRQFVVEKTKSLIIPFFFFFILSLPFRIGLHYWDFKSLETFNWWCLFDFLRIEERADYLFLNVPLWFLLCLFTMQLIYYGISYLPKWAIFILAMGALTFKDELYTIATPFMINNGCYYLGFFAMGHLFGKELINILMNKRKRLIMVFISLTFCFICMIISYKYPLLSMTNGFIHFRLFVIYFSLFVFLSYLDKNKQLGLVRFYGINSLMVLGYHIPVLILFDRISYRIFRADTVPLGVLSVLLTLFVLYFIIQWSNKHIPLLVGKNN